MKTYGIRNRNASASAERGLFRTGFFFAFVPTLTYLLFFFVVFGNFTGGLEHFRMPRFLPLHWVCFIMFAIATFFYLLSVRYHGNDSSNSLALPIKTRRNPKFRFNRTTLIGGVYSLVMAAWALANIIYANGVEVLDGWEVFTQVTQSVCYYL